MDDAVLWSAAAVFLFAGTIKGLVGIGLPTASIALLAQIADPRLAIALLMVPMFVANAWQLYRAGRIGRSVVLLWPFALTMIVAMWISARFAAAVPYATLQLAVGVVIVVFAASSLVREPPPIPGRLDRAVQLVAGAIAGVMGGLTAIWSPPMVVYLIARRFDRDDFIRFTGFLIFVGSLPLYLGYWQTGLVDRGTAAASSLMVVPTLAGFAIGEALRGRLANQAFRRAVLVVFALMGLNLIRRALWA